MQDTAIPPKRCCDEKPELFTETTNGGVLHGSSSRFKWKCEHCGNEGDWGSTSNMAAIEWNKPNEQVEFPNN